jgi:hypothetical protein
MGANLSTYRAVLTIPAGLDETRLAVVDDTNVIAEHVWRPSDNYQPGPATWDWALHRLGYDRITRWEPDPLGFRAGVERITRGATSDPGRAGRPDRRVAAANLAARMGRLVRPNRQRAEMGPAKPNGSRSWPSRRLHTRLVPWLGAIRRSGPRPARPYGPDRRTSGGDPWTVQLVSAARLGACSRSVP